MILIRNSASAILLAVGVLITYFMFLSVIPSDAQTGGGSTARAAQSNNCSGAKTANTTTGNGDKQSTVFNITSTSFLVTSNVTATGDPTFLFFSITVKDESGNTVTTIDQEQPGTQSSFVHAGPGRFFLDIFSANAEYRITVDDCTSTRNNNNNGNNNKQNKKHRQNNRVNRRHNIGHGVRQYNPINNPFRQYARNNGNIFNEQGEDNEPNDQNNASGNSSAPQSGGGNPSGNGDGGASASSGPGGTSTQAGGAAANGDNLPPVSSPQGNVVNEVPTSGPLPDTGGASLLWILPLMGLFVLAGLPLYRWISRRG